MVPGAATTIEKSGSFAHTIWDNLSALMIAIVGFYFGGKTLEITSANVADKTKGNTDSSGTSNNESSETN
jgi:hypothetical protein